MIKSKIEQNIPLQAVMNTVLDGIVIINSLGVIYSFNKSAERIFGYVSSEIVGQNVKMLMPDPYHSEHDGYLKNYTNISGAKVIGMGREVVAKRKDNTVFPMEISVSEMTVATGERMFFGIIRDISQRRKDEDDMKQGEARIKAIVDNIVDGLITIDDKGKIETFNLACTRIFGYRENEVIGNNVKMLMPDPYHRGHDGYLENYHKTGEKKVIGIGREVQGKKKDGSIFPLNLSVSAIDLGGRKVYSGILRDMTEYKKNEEEVLKAVEKLEESNMELERFAYAASHDLQEPLRMVVSFTGLLKEEYSNQLNEEACGYLNFASDAAIRMQALINDLLEYSKVGQEAERFVEFDCKQVIGNVLDNLAESVKQTRAVVTYDRIPVITANPIRVIRLFQNLIGNAIKYTPHDLNPIVHVSCESKDNLWVFSVADNGIGMKKDYLKKIFEPFKRLHSSSEYVGTGIGLAICKKIIENFGGDIWVESELQKGSIFYFTIPKLQKNKEN